MMREWDTGQSLRSSFGGGYSETDRPCSVAQFTLAFRQRPHRLGHGILAPESNRAPIWIRRCAARFPTNIGRVTGVNLTGGLSNREPERLPVSTKSRAAWVAPSHSTSMVATSTSVSRPVAAADGIYNYQYVGYVPGTMGQTRRSEIADGTVLNQYIGAKLRAERLAEKLTLDAIQARYGISRPQMNNLMKGGVNGGPKVWNRYAAVRHGGSLDSLSEAALAWSRDHRNAAPGAATSLASPNDVPHSMRIALEMGADDGMDPVFLKDFADANKGAVRTRTASTWWNKIRAAHDEWSESAPKSRPTIQAQLSPGSQKESAPGVPQQRLEGGPSRKDRRRG